MRTVIATLAAILTLAACVTINVYFPSVEAAEAADEILGTIRGNDDEQSAVWEARGVLLAAAGGVLDLIVPPAHAQAPDFSVKSPAIDKLVASLKQRFNQLKPYLDSGAVGVSNQGTEVIRDRNLIPLPERNKVRQLVEQQARDWDALYREIARVNNRPEWEGEIRRTFFERTQGSLRPGWWYQDAGGAWKQR